MNYKKLIYDRKVKNKVIMKIKTLLIIFLISLSARSQIKTIDTFFVKVQIPTKVINLIPYNNGQNWIWEHLKDEKGKEYLRARRPIRQREYDSLMKINLKNNQ